MSSSEESLFILHVYTVLHLYILIYFQDIDTGGLQIRLQVGLHERRFSTASGAEELDIHSSFYLSIENPAAIIIRTRDIRTDNQTTVTYACLIFGMLVYSYLRMMPFLSLEIFISHVNDFGQYKRHVNSWSES